MTAWKGDIELYTPEQQRKRRANKKSPGFLSGVIRLWNSIELTWSPEQRFAPPTADDGAGSGGASDTAATAATTTNTGVVEGIGKSSFVDLMVKVQHLVLTPPVSSTQSQADHTTTSSSQCMCTMMKPAVLVGGAAEKAK